MAVVLHPIISSIQKIALYETKHRLFVIASNNSENKFRVLKIDRLDPRDLTVIDDKVEYSRDEIRDLISMIDTGNRGRGGGALRPDVSAFGIVGFVRFTEGYYLVVVTARRKVAVIGLHSIYKIQDTAMVYLPHESVRVPHPDEPRYLKMFQSIDLSSNFYFSYGYDITNTLQVNMAIPRNLSHLQHPCDPRHYSFDSGVIERPDNEELFPSNQNEENPESSVEEGPRHYGVRSESNRRFVWNGHLLSEVEDHLHPDWILYVTHGFVSQSNVSVLGRSVYIALIARRSSKYAGTRFLKRGANFDGDVANEVETEQVVEDMGTSSVGNPRITSFVQMRGSIPAHWSQDVTRMVPKPPIVFDLSDAFSQTAGAHFNSLLGQYGSPVIILNLVKEREKKRHESQLSGEYTSAVAYLNQFLPPEHRVRYVHFDMARMNKGKGANVMGGLAEIARSAVMRTGLYASFQPPVVSPGRPAPAPDGPGRVQTGVVRVNCVDCLDRTNTAQFALGKCALAYQLFTLGAVSRPALEFDSDCVRLLEALYEDHGDTLALQYGGSQLVHRIKTYRKTAPWTSQGNDIMQTLSRYYSNTFSDTEKQHAMNLFLGLFVPGRQTGGPIWEQVTDYYLHNSFNRSLYTSRPLTQWWEDQVMECLPLSVAQCRKATRSLARIHTHDLEAIDAYADFHRPHEFSELAETYACKISHSVRDFMPHCVTDHSPFTVRVRPGRRREEAARAGANAAAKNPSLTGHSSTASTDSSDESEWEEISEGSGQDGWQASSPSRGEPASPHSVAHPPFPPLDTLFPSFQQTYGAPLHSPSRQDMHMYQRYVLMYRATCRLASSSGGGGEERVAPVSRPVPPDSSRETRVPRVSQRSISVYRQYVDRATGITAPLDRKKYEAYVRCELGVFAPTPWDR